MSELSLLEIGLAALAAFLVGFSKSGIKGINILTVTILAIVFGGKASTGILVPLLIAGDILAVSYYNRDCQWKYIFQLIPWMIIGVLLGVWIGKDLPEPLFKKIMASIILLTVVMMLWWENQDSRKIPKHWLFGGMMGLGAGFTTMVGNLAGVFTNIFFLAMRLPKAQFIGTAAWLFFIINLFKLPFHIFVWETIDAESFWLNLRLLLPLGIGFLMGTRLIKRIKEKQFRKMILLLTALGAMAILYKT